MSLTVFQLCLCVATVVQLSTSQPTTTCDVGQQANDDDVCGATSGRTEQVLDQLVTYVSQLQSANSQLHTAVSQLQTELSELQTNVAKLEAGAFRNAVLTASPM